MCVRVRDIQTCIHVHIYIRARTHTYIYIYIYTYTYAVSDVSVFSSMFNGRINRIQMHDKFSKQAQTSWLNRTSVFAKPLIKRNRQKHSPLSFWSGKGGKRR